MHEHFTKYLVAFFTPSFGAAVGESVKEGGWSIGTLISIGVLLAAAVRWQQRVNDRLENIEKSLQTMPCKNNESCTITIKHQGKK